MLHVLKNPRSVAHLFDGRDESFIYSALSGIMGGIAVTDSRNPRSAVASVGCFHLFAGEPNSELFTVRSPDFSIFVPPNSDWNILIEKCIPAAKKVTRYAFHKDTAFDTKQLTEIKNSLPEGYFFKDIDSETYDLCANEPQLADFVSAFQDKTAYLRYGRGVVVMKGGKIVSGASSFSSYPGGIEIEVDTIPEERRRHLALSASAALILKCLKDGLYPSWDAQNPPSLHLAEKLGYRFSHTYTAYEIKAPV